MKIHLIMTNWDFEIYKLTIKQINGKQFLLGLSRGMENCEAGLPKTTWRTMVRELEEVGLLWCSDAREWDRVLMRGMIAALCPSEDI